MSQETPVDGATSGYVYLGARLIIKYVARSRREIYLLTSENERDCRKIEAEQSWNRRTMLPCTIP